MRHGMGLASLKATRTRGVIGLPVSVLALSNVAVNTPADTSEDILATVPIPAGAMGLNGTLRVTAIWNVTNSANTKTCRIRFGGIAGTQYASLAMTTNATWNVEVRIGNRNSVSSQVGHSALSSVWGQTTATNITSAVDTSAAVDLVFTGQKASAGETLTLEAYIVELITA